MPFSYRKLFRHIEERGMTEGEFAQECGIPEKTLDLMHNYEKIPILDLKQISDYTGLKVQFIVFYFDDQTETEDEAEADYDAQTERYMMRLKEEERQKKEAEARGEVWVERLW